MNPEPSVHTFLSYSRVDQGFAHNLHDALENRGFDIWLDTHDIRAGRVWDSVIEHAIESALALIFVASPDSRKDSCLALNELHVARDAGVDIIPVMYRRCALPFIIRRTQYLDYDQLGFDTLVIKLQQDLQVVADSGDRRPEFKKLDTSLFYHAAVQEYESGSLENALNRVNLAERLNPQDADILLLKEMIKQAISDREKTRRLKELQEDADRDAGLYSEITRWAKVSTPGTNDFYGIAMFALALEAEGSHTEAITQLRRACKLEPRVRSKSWMTARYGWTEDKHRVLEQILIDLDTP